MTPMLRQGPPAFLCLVVAAACGCGGTSKCSSNADCPPQQHCFLEPAALEGVCRQECRATADCGDPGLRCDSLGRCVPWAIPQLDAGADAAGDAEADAAADAMADAVADAGTGDASDGGGFDTGIADGATATDATGDATLPAHAFVRARPPAPAASPASGGVARSTRLASPQPQPSCQP